MNCVNAGQTRFLAQAGRTRSRDFLLQLPSSNIHVTASAQHPGHSTFFTDKQYTQQRFCTHNISTLQHMLHTERTHTSLATHAQTWQHRKEQLVKQMQYNTEVLL